MARSIEKVARKLMKAIKQEAVREPNRIQRRHVGELAEHICKDQEEFNRVMRFITIQEGLINSWQKANGDVLAEPNDKGFEWINGGKSPLTLERASLIVGIIFTIAAFAWGVFVWLRPEK